MITFRLFPWQKSLAVCVALTWATFSLLAQNDTVFHFSFDGNLNDVSGNNVVLEDTISSTDDFWSVDSAGVYGNALALTGEFNTYLTISQTGLFEPVASDFTVCAWLKNKSEPSHYFEHIVLHQRGGPGATRYYLANIGENDAPDQSDSLIAGCFVSGFASRGNILLPRNEWYHLTAVGKYQDSTISFYVNGVLDTTVKVNAFEAASGGFQVGKHQATNPNKNNATWVGLIDDLYLISKALTEAEIKEVAGAGPTARDRAQLAPIAVYPNPTSDILQIELPASTQSRVEASIYNAAGAQVKLITIDANAPVLDLADLVPGMYILELTAGEKTYSAKFVKQE